MKNISRKFYFFSLAFFGGVVIFVVLYALYLLPLEKPEIAIEKTAVEEVKTQIAVEVVETEEVPEQGAVEVSVRIADPDEEQEEEAVSTSELLQNTERKTVDGVVVNAVYVSVDDVEGYYSFDGNWMCPPQDYDIHYEMNYIVEERLTLVGTMDGIEFYKPSDSADYLCHDVFEQSCTPLEYKDFVADHNILLFEDELGNWIRLTNIEIYPEISEECDSTDSEE